MTNEETEQRTVTEGEAREMLTRLGITLPSVGDEWWWEPMLDHARQLVRVTAVEWNGEEWWVTSTGPLGEYPNELSRWHEATVLHLPANP